MSVRRAVDIFGALFALTLVSPVILIAIVAIYITDPGPVLFRQQRAGLGGRPFTIFKFRSMRINALAHDNVTEIRKGHPLLTPVGGLIRRLKVDELPQMFNVLRGDMAIIGPRPTVPEQVEEYTPYERRRLEILPGLTGWAQVNGGIDITWSERILLDVWYIDHRTFWLDMYIVMRTFMVIFGGEQDGPERLRKAREYARTQMSSPRLRTGSAR